MPLPSPNFIAGVFVIAVCIVVLLSLAGGSRD